METYPRVVNNQDEIVFNPFQEMFGDGPYLFSSDDITDDCVVKVHLPARSLLVMYGPARYEWEHHIVRSDITERRITLAYRELTPPYLPGGDQEEDGSLILEQARRFW